MGLSQQIGASSLIKPGVIDNSAQRPASPYEGQVIFQKDTDQLLVWNGTAWVIPNAPAQNPMGLELIKTDTITSGTNKEITGVFSSTYSNYRIIVSNLRGSSDFGLRFRLGTAATGIYYYAGVYSVYSSAVLSIENGVANTHYTTGIVGSSGIDVGGWIELQQPNTADFTSIQSQGTDIRTGGGGIRLYSGFANNTTQYTSFSLDTGGATFVTCDVSVYGYRSA